MRVVLFVCALFLFSSVFELSCSGNFALSCCVCRPEEPNGGSEADTPASKMRTRRRPAQYEDFISAELDLLHDPLFVEPSVRVCAYVRVGACVCGCVRVCGCVCVVGV